MFKIYLGLVQTALPISIIVWSLTILLIHKNIKKKWLFLLFPLTILSIPIYYISLSVLDKSIIILNTIIIVYYMWKMWRNKINIIDIEIIPVIQMIELLYLTNMYRGICIVAA